jgi:hypothetical protein
LEAEPAVGKVKKNVVPMPSVLSNQSLPDAVPPFFTQDET